MPHIQVSTDAHIYYEDFGQGIPLVFTHAGSTTHSMWEHQVDALSNEFRTITWDWRGVGQSSKPNGPYTIDTLVHDLVTLTTTLGLENFVLVGHGFGSHVAIMAAEKLGRSVAGLVLTSTAPWCSGSRDGVEGGFSDEYLAWMKARMGSVGVSSSAAYAALFREWLFKLPAQDVDVHAAVACATQTPLFVMNSYRRSIAQVDHRERARKIEVPTLIIQGRHDRKQRYGGAVHFQTLIPGARLETFEDSAHMPQVEEMGHYNEVLASFAKSTRAG